MNDLISRQDAVSRIADLLMLELQGKRIPTWDEVHNAMQDLPSANQWIPCSERLPDKGQEVLATMDYGDITMAEYLGGDDWFTQEGNANSCTEEILAWMPLPEPWKGEKDECTD